MLRNSRGAAHRQLSHRRQQPNASTQSSDAFYNGRIMLSTDPFASFELTELTGALDGFEPPLDAFDRQLLAELPPDRREPAFEQSKTIRDDLQQSAPFVNFESSSTGPATSPTVSALQNRRPQTQKPVVRPADTFTQEHKPSQSLTSRPTSEFDKSTLQLKHAGPVVRGIQLVPRSELPDQLGSIFHHPIFNVVQSKCFPIAFQSDDNLVVSAPTGSGKTAVMELALCRLISNRKNQDFKAVYMAPTKSLCAERQNDWCKRFKALGIECAELTGDTEYNNLRNVQQAQVIITTPEKWDSVTRKWRDNQRLMQLIKLFLVDEVHILKDSRGATLEAVVSRMKSTGVDVRFIALSATVPNSEDIATWLGQTASTPDVPARREVFDESYRPVKLEKHVYGFQGGANDFSFDALLMKQVPDCIVRHSAKKSTMVFCMTRKSCNQTAQTLANFWNTFSAQQKPWPAPTNAAAFENKDLSPLARARVAFHHGGLTLEDRKRIEQGFLRGDIKVICSTSTLAVGVNLPCYLVVLQGTLAWTAQGAQEYSDLEMLQMLGRAGRPQFERNACAVILTRHEKIQRYEKMVSGQELLESTLHRNLIEHLNAEIGLGTVYDVDSAKRWLNSTFFRVRLTRNPKHYQIEGSDFQNPDELIQELCEKDIRLLEEPGFIDRSTRVKCTELGDAMARYYVSYETMKTFTSIPPKAKMSEILMVLCHAVEFLEARIKNGEKSYYKELNKANDIRFPINVDIALTAHKVSLIVQSELANVSAPSGANFDKLHGQHNTDVAIVFSHAKRLIRCIIDCQLYLQDAISTRNALELCRSIAARAWDGTPNQIKQIPGIGPVAVRKLAAKGINSVEAMIDSPPERLALILGKQQQQCHTLLKSVQSFPDLRVTVKEVGREVQNGKGVKLKLKCELGFLNEIKPISFGKVAVYVCFLVEDSTGKLHDFRRFGARKLHNGEEVGLTADLTKPTSWIRCHVMCDEIAGTSKHAELAIKDVPPNVYATDGSEAADIRKNAFTTAKNIKNVTSDDFDDEGLVDEDLLKAAQYEDDSIELVEDIDEILTAVEKNSGVRTGPSESKRTRPVAESTSVIDDQTQLENGNWTCRHSCKEKGINCKHKCCREGVKSRRKRTKKTTDMEDAEHRQQKITSMAQPIAKSTHPSAIAAGSLDGQHQTTPAFGNPMLAAYKAPQIPGLNQVRKRPHHDHDSETVIAQKKSRRARKDPDQLAEAKEPMEDIECDIDDLELGTGSLDPFDCDWNLGDTGHGTSQIGIEGSRPLRLSAHDESVDPSMSTYKQASASISNTPPTPLPSHRNESLPNITELLNGDNIATEDGPRIHSDEVDLDEIFRTVERNMSKSSNQALQQLPQGPSSSKITHNSHKENEEAAKMVETQEEKEKRLWEEDQKRRWEGLEPWLYDMFHNIVELVD